MPPKCLTEDPPAVPEVWIPALSSAHPDEPSLLFSLLLKWNPGDLQPKDRWAIQGIYNWEDAADELTPASPFGGKQFACTEGNPAHHFLATTQVKFINTCTPSGLP